jgi:predicted Kef-type K+ transport protein
MIALWIACAYALGLLVKRIGLPPLVGFLAAGFLLQALGYESGEALEEIAHLGVLLLLFSVGLKVRLRNTVRPEVWATALVHLGITTLLVGLGIHAVTGLPWLTAFILASALGFSSTVLAAKILEEKREVRAFHGRVAIGILIVQDLIAVTLVYTTEAQTPSPWALLLLALPLLRPLIGRLLVSSGHGELLIMFGMLLALVVGGLGFEAAGLSAELGALVMGAMLASHPSATELSDALWSLKEVLLVGFFLNVGMMGLPNLYAIEFALALLVLLPIKAALFFFLLLMFSLRARTSFLSSLSLASYSEFGLIFAGLAAGGGLLGPEWVVMLAITVALSFAVTAPLHRLAHAFYDRYSSTLVRFERMEKHPDDSPISLGSAEVAILGMGRLGSGAYDYLKGKGLRVVGLDSDPGEVQQQLAAGRRVTYGDAEDSSFWQRLNLEGLRAILLTLPDVEAKMFAADQLRRRGYEGLISATNVYPEEAPEIMHMGCTTTYNYFDEAGVGFGQHAWEALEPAGEGAD